MRGSHLPQMLPIALGLLILIGCRHPVPAATGTPIPPSVTPTLAPTRTPTHIPMPTPTLTPVLSSCPGERLAFVMSSRGNNGVYVACPDSGSIDYAINLSQYEYLGPLSFSQHGDAMFLIDTHDQRGDQIIMVDLVSFRSTVVLPGSAGKRIAYVHWTLDGQYVGYVNLFDSDPEQKKNDVIEFLNIAKQTVSRFELEGDVGLQDFQWSADGRRILYLNSTGLQGATSPEYGMFLADVSCDNETGQCEVTNIRPLKAVGRDPSFSFDGSQIVSVSQTAVEDSPQEIIVISDLSDRVIYKVVADQLNPALTFVLDPVFSPDGSSIAFTADSVDTGVRNVYILDLKQMTLLNLTGNTSKDTDYGDVTW